MLPVTTDPRTTPAARYAAGVDHRDVDLFLSAFDPEGSLTILPPEGSAAAPRVMRGHGELAAVIDRIARYDRTFHLVAQCLFSVEGDDTVRSETYCVAHHWKALGGRIEDTVLYIRYEDLCRRGADGEWRIVQRTLHTDGRETRDVGARRPAER